MISILFKWNKYHSIYMFLNISFFINDFKKYYVKKITWNKNYVIKVNFETMKLIFGLFSIKLLIFLNIFKLIKIIKMKNAWFWSWYFSIYLGPPRNLSNTIETKRQLNLVKTNHFRMIDSSWYDKNFWFTWSIIEGNIYTSNKW